MKISNKKGRIGDAGGGERQELLEWHKKGEGVGCSTGMGAGPRDSHQGSRRDTRCGGALISTIFSLARASFGVPAPTLSLI